jgi:Flp pilus assembly protein TadG
MRGKRFTRLRDERGAQAVEFALVSLPLLYLLYGLIAFGFTFNASETATQLAREGARVTAICGTSGGCTAQAIARINANKPPGFTVQSVNVTECTSGTGDAIVIVHTRPPLTFVPFLTGGGGGTDIKGKAVTPCGG